MAVSNVNEPRVAPRNASTDVKAPNAAAPTPATPSKLEVKDTLDKTTNRATSKRPAEPTMPPVPAPTSSTRPDSPARFSPRNLRNNGVSCADITVHIRAKNGWSSVLPGCDDFSVIGLTLATGSAAVPNPHRRAVPAAGIHPLGRLFTDTDALVQAGQRAR